MSRDQTLQDYFVGFIIYFLGDLIRKKECD